MSGGLPGGAMPGGGGPHSLQPQPSHGRGGFLGQLSQAAGMRPPGFPVAGGGLPLDAMARGGAYPPGVMAPGMGYQQEQAPGMGYLQGQHPGGHGFPMAASAMAMPMQTGLAGYGLRSGSRIRPGHVRQAREVLELIGSVAESATAYVQLVHQDVRFESAQRYAEMQVAAAAIDSHVAFGLANGLSLEQLLAMDSLEIECSRLGALNYFTWSGDLHGMIEGSAVSTDGYLFSATTRARLNKSTRESYKLDEAMRDGPAGRGRGRGRNRRDPVDTGRGCPACGGRHQVKDCPVVLEAKKQLEAKKKDGAPDGGRQPR